MDTLREKRLERVRRSQLEWATNLLCNDIAKELLGEAVRNSEKRICTDIVETTIVDECWKKLEYARIMREILAGDINLKLEIERRPCRWTLWQADGEGDVLSKPGAH